MVLVPSATAGGVPLVLARLVEGLSTHQCASGPWRLEDRRNCSQVSPCAGRLPSGRGPNADRPSMSWAMSTARRIAAATWIMSSTTVASRAYAVVPAKRSRSSRGGAYRPRSAPAAGSARHRADAGRRDRAARSPDPQPASCRRSFRRGYRARAAPSTRHHWRPRPDRQPVPGCVGRDVLAGACVPTSGPAGAVPVRVRSRSSAGLRWRRGRLWHPRRKHRPLRTGAGLGRSMRGTPVRASGTSNLRPWNPVVRAITGLSPCPWNRTRTPRECPEGSAPEGDRPTVFGTVSRLGWPPERRGYALAWLLSPRNEHWRDASAGKKAHE